MTMLVVFDGDNTLWDTNAVFLEAQLALLSTFQEAGIINDHESMVGTLRIIDSELAKKFELFEYDFTHLANSLLYYILHNTTISDSIIHVIDEEYNSCDEHNEIIRIAIERYHTALTRIPDLYPDTLLVLRHLREGCRNKEIVHTILFTEGNAERIQRIVTSYKLVEDSLIEEVVIHVKEVATLYDIRDRYDKIDANIGRYIYIGDSLHRDIKIGNLAGFETIYKRAGFFGHETSSDSTDTPRYSIDRLGEVLRYL